MNTMLGQRVFQSAVRTFGRPAPAVDTPAMGAPAVDRSTEAVSTSAPVATVAALTPTPTAVAVQSNLLRFFGGTQAEAKGAAVVCDPTARKRPREAQRVTQRAASRPKLDKSKASKVTKASKSAKGAESASEEVTEDRASEASESSESSESGSKSDSEDTRPTSFRGGAVRHVISSAFGSFVGSGEELEQAPCSDSEDEPFVSDPAWEAQHAALPAEQRELWSQALAPSTMTDLVGQSRAKTTLLTWWGAMRSGSSSGIGSSSSRKAPGLPACALLHGPTGTGKTLMAHLAAAMYGYRLVVLDLERDASMHKGDTVAKQVASLCEDALALLSHNSLQRFASATRAEGERRPVALLIEHIDDQDPKVLQLAKAVLAKWTASAQTAPAPRGVLLFTCSDAWDKRLSGPAGLQSRAQCVEFVRLEPAHMRQALSASCARSSAAPAQAAQAALLDACNGQVGSALLCLQFLSSHRGLGAQDMRVDVVHSARETARAALGRGALSDHAAADVEGVVFALHAALPSAAEFGNPQVVQRLTELRAVGGAASSAVGGAGSSSVAQVTQSLREESMAAVAQSLDALSMHDVAESHAFLDPTRPRLAHLAAYMAAEGIGAPLRELRKRRGLAHVSVDMGPAFNVPEYLRRKGDALRVLQEQRDKLEALATQGCEVTESGERAGPTRRGGFRGGAKCTALPPHLQNLGHVRPSADELGDYSLLFPRAWISGTTRKRADEILE